MSKHIYITESEIQSITDKLREQLKNSKFCRDVNFQAALGTDDRRAKLKFTSTAWIKMVSLVEVYTTEVEWHGLVRRTDESSFEVYDILVFPHACNGGSVLSDQEEYQQWLDELNDDEFNAMRFHGHSHVNMGVTPSGTYGVIINGNTDESYRARMVQSMPNNNEPSNYYIFFIMNKSLEWSARIYDVANNAIYEKDEIELEIELDGAVTLHDFLADAKRKTEPKPKLVSVPKEVSIKADGFAYFKDTNKCKKDKDKNNKKENYSWFDDESDTPRSRGWWY